MVQPPSASSVVHVLDFDHARLARLVAEEPAGREVLRARLGDDGARVKVVTRRFYCAVGGEVDDMEYPWPARCPPEWAEHLRRLLTQADEDADDEDGDGEGRRHIDPLEYDEPPEEHRAPIPFGYVQSALQLGGAVDARRLAITERAIIEMPRPGETGNVFFFE